jgi:hypothetical protein
MLNMKRIVMLSVVLALFSVLAIGTASAATYTINMTNHETTDNVDTSKYISKNSIMNVKQVIPYVNNYNAKSKTTYKITTKNKKTKIKNAVVKWIYYDKALDKNVTVKKTYNGKNKRSLAFTLPKKANVYTAYNYTLGANYTYTNYENYRMLDFVVKYKGSKIKKEKGSAFIFNESKTRKNYKAQKVSIQEDPFTFAMDYYYVDYRTFNDVRIYKITSKSKMKSITLTFSYLVYNVANGTNEIKYMTKTIKGKNKKEIKYTFNGLYKYTYTRTAGRINTTYSYYEHYALETVVVKT